ncbi:5-(carboxyamino)imidazole ribonucleotide synthase [Inhella gelatinilytica]|uniref:N5-carboxyaminoimidazole ribonucleotide synthase n=1 Tax=Inhella gelatinilytica TaxID=2795030 RepID=A0A931IYM4_9BURK|nr:5-(carboxyamino)imidazole ribonucleotide synthase [Inhella gelatinilytica]MBH9552226.1 5-(carboxyamino)imidazole ribonucleotide synthase [Inhella gelatinilytica]
MSAPTLNPLHPGEWLGMLGGGQLGRMAVHAAQALGYRVAVLDPDRHSPAGAAADEHLQAGYDDAGALTQLASRCAAASTEFENVPAAALSRLAQDIDVAPAAIAVAVCQDRAAEKAHFQKAGVPCAPHAVLRGAADCAGVDPALLPGILKTARMGYDGKGQRRVNDAAELAAAFAELGGVTCVLEQRLPLAAELSVIVSRGVDGQMVTLPVQRNWHVNGILATTAVPAQGIAAELQAQAQQFAQSLAAEFGYVGVLCVEFFVLEDGRLLANEMAPRPHNSGHYSIDACSHSQFELQVRAMAQLPLPEPRLHSACVMLNLLGDLWFDAQGHRREPNWAAVLRLEGMHLHLYGKADPRPGRKMGHLTVTAPTAWEARGQALAAARVLGLPEDGLV